MPDIYTKICRSEQAFHNELLIYRSDYPYKADLLAVHEPDTIILQHLEATPYLDSGTQLSIIIPQLAIAVGALHRLSTNREFAMCHGDNQPKNILWSENEQKVYLVDFEDVHPDCAEADITHLFLFWGELLPETDFRLAVQLFLQHYTGSVLSNDRWQRELLLSIRRFTDRRTKFQKTERRDNPDAAANREYLKQFPWGKSSAVTPDG
jgi:serine/threonine protein kinase